VQHKKEVKKLREFESTLLNHYQRYVRHIDATIKGSTVLITSLFVQAY